MNMNITHNGKATIENDNIIFNQDNNNIVISFEDFEYLYKKRKQFKKYPDTKEFFPFSLGLNNTTDIEINFRSIVLIENNNTIVLTNNDIVSISLFVPIKNVDVEKWGKIFNQYLKDMETINTNIVLKDLMKLIINEIEVM